MTFNPHNFTKIQAVINKYCDDIRTTPKIIAVSKTHSYEVIIQAIKHGVIHFGENKVQEAIFKFSSIKNNFPNIKVHMVGGLQSNKVKQALGVFDYFHSLDRYSLVKEFSKHINLCKNKKFFIQVNTGDEDQKSGIAINDVDKFISYCQYEIGLNIIGLMCIPPIKEDPETHFKILKKISIKNKLKHLSMGMSSDYKMALECGSTFVRIGTYFFGERKLINEN